MATRKSPSAVRFEQMYDGSIIQRPVKTFCGLNFLLGCFCLGHSDAAVQQFVRKSLCANLKIKTWSLN